MTSLNRLLNRPDIWQGRSPSPLKKTGATTGIAALDQLLGGGWPNSGLTELALQTPGLGEMTLLLEAQKQSCSEKRWVVWLNPPYTPYPPALDHAGIRLEQLIQLHCRKPVDWLWSAEQCLRSGAMLLAWPPGPIRYAELRKLQVLSSEYRASMFLFRASNTLTEHSPAQLRLSLEQQQQQIQITLHKQRGSYAGQQLLIQHPSLITLFNEKREQRSLMRMPSYPSIVAYQNGSSSDTVSLWQ